VTAQSATGATKGVAEVPIAVLRNGKAAPAVVAPGTGTRMEVDVEPEQQLSSHTAADGSGHSGRDAVDVVMDLEMLHGGHAAVGGSAAADDDVRMQRAAAGIGSARATAGEDSGEQAKVQEKKRLLDEAEAGADLAANDIDGAARSEPDQLHKGNKKIRKWSAAAAAAGLPGSGRLAAETAGIGGAASSRQWPDGFKACRSP